MNNNLMVDSSVLVEYAKGTKTALFTSIVTDKDIDSYINETVVSEFLFQFLKLSTGKAPKTLQESGKIPVIIQNSNKYTILNLFDYLPSTSEIIFAVPAFMEKYNLLPNDAIILATCKIHGITQLASHDSDFIIPCKAEGITLIREP